MKDYKLVLASSSPRRRALLGEAGVEFIVSEPGVDERFHPELSPVQNAENTAMNKARAVSRLYPADPVLGADTIVVLDGQVIGKPEDEKHAEWMLNSLSGREHQVVTGFAIVHAGRELFVKSSSVSKVRFRNVAPDDIKRYVAGGEPMDKAGAYAIQGGAAMWVESYSGSYSNIIGLPMEDVRETFLGLGYDIFP